MEMPGCWRPTLRLVFLGVLAGCGGTTEVITPPPPPPTDFIIDFRPDTAAAATAQALGWQGGIPTVDAIIRPEDTTKSGSLTLRSDAQGRLVLTGVPAGSYVLDASRWLTSAERSRLPPSDDALGFVNRQAVVVSAGGQTALPLLASRRRGIVISEWAFNQGDGYDLAGFLELYNNADTTSYLDGMIVGEGFNLDFDYPVSPCAENAPYTNDGQGIWSRYFSKFPGTGRSFPMAPGQTVVIATDAIDHRPLSVHGLDLSHADFEFSGPADADNPAVPNMVDLGPRFNLVGHGTLFAGLSAVVVLAQPGDPATFTLARFAEDNYQRIPRGLIADVMSLRSNFETGFRPCPQLVSLVFDRQESYVRGGDDVAEQQFSVSRRVVPGSGGVALLQRSGSSHADLLRTPRTPKTVQ